MTISLKLLKHNLTSDKAAGATFKGERAIVAVVHLHNEDSSISGGDVCDGPGEKL